jgi:hypothetical protein
MPEHVVHWIWEDAFDKFGFGDGDGINFTDKVIDVLENMGYAVEADNWGIHNYMIFQIKDQSGNDIIPDSAKVGYDNPRVYLPKDIIDRLDKEFPDTPAQESFADTSGVPDSLLTQLCKEGLF